MNVKRLRFLFCKLQPTNSELILTTIDPNLFRFLTEKWRLIDRFLVIAFILVSSYFMNSRR
jgi:hypothetical protein